MRTLAIATLAAAVLVTAQGSLAADAGVPGKKLILLNKAVFGKLKTVYVSKSSADPGIAKGAAGDPTLLDGTFDWFYETDGATSVFGCFLIEDSTPSFQGEWVKNTDAVAKYANEDAKVCGGGRCTKVAVIKPAKVAKVVALGLGDFGGGGSFSEGAPTASDGVSTILTINNGNDSSTHRMCTKFATDSGSTVILKEIAGGQGQKLIGKNGVPVACPPSPCPTP
jgi:hypothetical protein